MKKYPWMFDLNLYLAMFFMVLGIYKMHTGQEFGELFAALGVCNGLTFRINKLEWRLDKEGL